MQKLKKQQIQSLCQYLYEHGGLASCDGSFKLTRKWIEIEGLSPFEVIEFLQERGAYCDCQVLLNVQFDPLYF